MAKEIPLTKGKVAIVDDEDFEWLNQWKWYYSSFGYARRSTEKGGKKTIIYMHKLILGIPNKLKGDHVDGNTLNNQRFNLRPATHQQNLFNQRIQKRQKSSKYKVVIWHKKNKNWHAYIKVNQKQISLGSYIEEQEAASAYNRAAIKYFGKFAKLNEIESGVAC
jgi:hypothetical protein